MKKRALIVGVIRNGGSRLRKSIRALKAAFESKFELAYFVVESDSSDNTLRELQGLKESTDNFDFVSLGKLQPSIPDRLQRLARCRNEYMAYFDARQSEFDFLIIADLDGINIGLSERSLSFLESFGSEYAGLFANQTGPYYDIGALRCKGWSERDPFAQLNDLLAAGVPFETAQKAAVSSKMIRIPRKAQPIPVESAYGGLAIHPSKCVRGMRYNTGENNEVEIVSFNRELARSSNLPLYIVPSMINSQYTEHTSQFSPLGRGLYYGTFLLRKILRRITPISIASKLSEFERRLFGR